MAFLRESLRDHDIDYATGRIGRALGLLAIPMMLEMSMVTRALSSRRHPQQSYRSCLGILRLEKPFGDKRLEAACGRALLLGSCRYKSIESILKHGLDSRPLPEQQELDIPEDHDNIRGPSYYH